MKSATTKMKTNRWQFRLPWRCTGMTWAASPNRARPGLHWKPLDASVGQVPTPYRPMVNEFVETTQNTNTINFSARPSALGQPLQVVAHAPNWGDSLNRQTEHHIDDVCGGSCVDAQQISRTPSPTVGNLLGDHHCWNFPMSRISWIGNLS